MKRFHVNLGVKNIDESTAFYTALFGASPTVKKDDYAKWMLDDPRINFAIHLKHYDFGVEHLGLQVDALEELDEVYAGMENAKGKVDHEGETVCCYAKSEKSWIKDPQGVEWEAFYTFGESTVYGKEKETKADGDENKEGVRACCASVLAV
ncbi:MAG: ArsI/CadI family heavy metal resistance metalloenzyme [Bacteroidia bacterium]